MSKQPKFKVSEMNQVTFCSNSKILEYEQEVIFLMENLGKVNVFVSNVTKISNICKNQKKIDKLSEELGFAIKKEDFLCDVAERMVEGDNEEDEEE